MQSSDNEGAEDTDKFFDEFANQLGKKIPEVVHEQSKKRFLRHVATSVSPYAKRIREAIANAASGPEATAAIKMLNTAYSEFVLKGFRGLAKPMFNDTKAIAGDTAKAVVPFIGALTVKTAARTLFVGKPGEPVPTDEEIDKHVERILGMRMGDSTLGQILHDVSVNACRAELCGCSVCYGRSVYGCERCDGRGLSDCSVCNGGTKNYIQCTSCGGRPQTMTGGMAEDLIAQKMLLKPVAPSELGKAIVASEGMYDALYKAIKEKHHAANGGNDFNDDDDDKWDTDAAKEAETMIASVIQPAVEKAVEQDVIDKISTELLRSSVPPAPVAPPGPVDMVGTPYNPTQIPYIPTPLPPPPLPPRDAVVAPKLSSVTTTPAKTVARKSEPLFTRDEYSELMSQPIVKSLAAGTDAALVQAAPAVGNVLTTAFNSVSKQPRPNLFKNFKFRARDPANKPDPAAIEAGGLRAKLATLMPYLRDFGRGAADFGKGAAGAGGDVVTTASGALIPIAREVSGEVAKFVSSKEFQSIIRELSATAAHAVGEVIKDTLAGGGKAVGEISKEAIAGIGKGVGEGLHGAVTGSKPRNHHSTRLSVLAIEHDPRDLVSLTCGRPLNHSDMGTVLGHIHYLHSLGMKSSAFLLLQKSCNVVEDAHGFATEVCNMNVRTQHRVQNLLAELITAALYHVNKRNIALREEERCIIARAISCTIGALLFPCERDLTDELLKLTHLNAEQITERVGATSDESLVRIIRFSTTAYSHIARAGRRSLHEIHNDFADHWHSAIRK